MRFALVFRRNRLDVHRLKPTGRAGEFRESFSYDEVSYGRGDSPSHMAIETFLRAGGVEFPVHGWFERDLRKAIAPLGVSLDPIAGAAPIPVRKTELPEEIE